MGDAKLDDDAILKSFLAEVGEVERDNEVVRILSCFRLNPFEHLNLSFDSSTDDVKRQYRKVFFTSVTYTMRRYLIHSKLCVRFFFLSDFFDGVHRDKCKHPQAQEAFGAQQLLLNDQERDYILTQVHAAKEELKMKRKETVEERYSL
ncbi:hypothetical protein Bca52824_004743 [Brassica carinata]|uniref:Uncharacterized protein n=1 Tax=Brassica carinata TaxID=52824 RepID=A0A8X8BGD8_BRACI|nr:hypothetical protein Bca52824_004743 [Brassica carinata]